MGSPPEIETHSLGKTYLRPALREVTFEVKSGEIVTLIGPNGAGKSSLMRILAGLLLPSTGRARVGQCDVVKDRPRSRRQVGVALSNDRGLSSRLSVRDNLIFFGALYGLPGRQTLQRIHQLAIPFESEKLLSKPVRTLSSGEKARIVLIRAMLHRPRVLLLDEVTQSLDPGTAARIRLELLRQVEQDGTAVLLATHDLVEAKLLGKRTLLLNHGSVEAFGNYLSIESTVTAAFRIER